MNSQQIKQLLVLLSGLIIGISFLVFVLYSRKSPELSSNIYRQTPQCAHWAIYRSCQILGIPTETGEIQKRLPHHPKGHTMIQIIDILNTLGIKAEGFRDNWNSLSALSFPCIAHLRNPDHYIVISGIEMQNEYIHIFDDSGNRIRQTREAFEKRWSGMTLHLTRPAIPHLDNKRPSPHAVFSHLLIDKGDIPATGESSEFIFPISNSGSDDLVIEDIKVNCSCLKSEKPKKPIHPGETDNIRLFYSVKPSNGAFMETAAVKTNDPKNPIVVLTAAGFTGVEVRVDPSAIRLNKLLAGYPCTINCFIRYTGQWSDFEFEVESFKIENATLISSKIIPIEKVSSQITGITLPQVISDQSKKYIRMLELKFMPENILFDKVEGEIILKTNIPGYERFVISVSGEIIPAVGMYPSIIDFRHSQVTPVIITLVSRTNEPFTIDSFDNPCEFFDIKYDSTNFEIEKKLNCLLNGEKTNIPLDDKCTIRVKFKSGFSIDLPITIILP